MSNEQEQFEKLRLLLSVKRYEQPPPGYFNRLSADIRAQLRSSGSLGDISVEEQLGLQVPWLHRLWTALESKPIFAGSFGVAICGLLLAGIAYHTSPDTAPAAMVPVAEASMSTLESAPVMISAQLPTPPVYTAANVGAMLASTSHVMSLTPTPLQRHPYAMPVSGEFR